MVGRGEIRYAYRANFNLPLLYIQSNYFMAKCIFVSCLVRDKLLYEPIVRWTILRPLSAASNDLSRVVCVAKFDIAEFAIQTRCWLKLPFNDSRFRLHFTLRIGSKFSELRCGFAFRIKYHVQRIIVTKHLLIVQQRVIAASKISCFEYHWQIKG